MRTPAVSVADTDVIFARLSIYVAQDVGLTEWPKRLPSVLSSLWRNKEGSYLFALASIVDEPVSLTIDAAHLPVGLGNFELSFVDEGGRKMIASIGSTALSLTLQASGAGVLELKPR